MRDKTKLTNVAKYILGVVVFLVFPASSWAKTIIDYVEFNDLLKFGSNITATLRVCGYYETNQYYLLAGLTTEKAMLKSVRRAGFMDSSYAENQANYIGVFTNIEIKNFSILREKGSFDEIFAQCDTAKRLSKTVMEQLSEAVVRKPSR